MLKIGIPAQNHEDKFGVNINYLEWIYNFGRPVIIMPETYDFYKEIYKIDALVLPGGSDVNSNRYTNLPSLGTYQPNIYLEHFDANILPKLIGNMPIFGICRGLQTLNVLFGGTLRNLMWHPYSTHDSQEVHKIETNEKTKALMEFKVNSFHHQGILKLGVDLTVEATASDKVIEAISNYSKRIFAVQWHPERLLDWYSTEKFKSILS